MVYFLMENRTVERGSSKSAFGKFINKPRQAHTHIRCGNRRKILTRNWNKARHKNWLGGLVSIHSSIHPSMCLLCVRRSTLHKKLHSKTSDMIFRPKKIRQRQGPAVLIVAIVVLFPNKTPGCRRAS